MLKDQLEIPIASPTRSSFSKQPVEFTV